MISDAPESLTYLTTKDLAVYLRYSGPVQALKFIERHGLRRYPRSGRVLLVKRSDVDAVLAGER